MKMEQRVLRDLICTVREEMNWGCIVEAYTRGLPTGFFTAGQAKSIEALRDASILDRRNELDAKWRKAIDDVHAGRAIHELPDDDKDRIVIRACS